MTFIREYDFLVLGEKRIFKRQIKNICVYLHTFMRLLCIAACIATHTNAGEGSVKVPASTNMATQEGYVSLIFLFFCDGALTIFKCLESSLSIFLKIWSTTAPMIFSNTAL